MRYSVKGIIYRLFIDPLLLGLRRSVAGHIRPGDRVLDVACGTGALSVTIASRAEHVTGIDLSEDMIITAIRTANRRGISNVSFEIRDASDLSCYRENEFDVAVTSMAVHQFDEDLAVKILSEMNRTSNKIIMADYNFPMRRNLSSLLAWSIEWAAAEDHYRNFRNYMKRGGITWFAEQAGLKLEFTEIRGYGVFRIVKSSHLL